MCRVVSLVQRDRNRASYRSVWTRRDQTVLSSGDETSQLASSSSTTNTSVCVLALPPATKQSHSSESQRGSGRVEELAPEERSNARMQATNNPDMRGTTDASDKVSHSPGLPLASNSAVCAAFQRLDSAALLHNSRGCQLQGDAGTTRPGQSIQWGKQERRNSQFKKS